MPKRIPRSNLTAPSPLLREVRQHFIEAGGSPDAFDFAVADYTAKAISSERHSKSAPAAIDSERITIIHEDGNTVAGTLDDVLNHGHLKRGWKYVSEPPTPDPSP